MMQRYALFLIGVLSCFSIQAHPGISSIEFVENKGQWAHPFLYKAATSNSDIYLEENGFTFVLGSPENGARVHGLKEHKLTGPQILKFHAYKIVFAGAQKPSEVIGSKPQPYYHNYFLGNDPARWKSNIYPVRNVDYKTLYPGIDLHIASQDNALKYDLIVAPGANTDNIQLNYIGTDGISVKNDILMVQTSIGVVKEMKPYAYQYINGEKKEVKCRYKVKGNTVSFSFPQGYDNTAQLVIDPTVDFATFTGSTTDNWGYTATYDAQGNLYGGGATTGTGYPVTTGAFDVSFNGGGSGGNVGFECDMTITKYNATGNSNLYSTYIGGSDNDQPHSMIVDNSGNLVIAGRSYSSNYPTQNGYKMSRTGSDADIVLTKLNATGSALIGSTYFGGSSDDGVNIDADWNVHSSLKESYGDDARSEVIVDNQGNIYMAGSTKSSGLAINGSLSGTQDGVVLKFSSNLSTLTWGTYIGGTGNDAAYVLALNQAQTLLYTAGGTEGGAIPASATTGVYDATHNGGIDGFIARFINSGTYTLDRGTYLGTNAYDQSFGVQVDMSDNVYAAGQTLGSAFPHTTVFGQASAPQFIVKLDPALGSLTYATRFGSPNSTAPNITPVAFLVDTCENVYVSGWGGQVAGNGGSTANMPIMMNSVSPSGILSTTTTDGSDFYFMVMRKNGTAQLFGAYYGSGTIPEHVDGGTSRFDKYGKIYQAICGCGGTGSNLPMTPGAYRTSNGSGNCNLATIKIAFDFGAPNADFKVIPDGKICFGDPIQFQNLSTNAQQYEWDFGDGSAMNTQHTPPPHTYATIGTFVIRLIAINPDACRIRDTAFVTVVIDSASIKADFIVNVTKSCDPYEAVLTNTSQYSKTPGSQNFTTFSWSYGFPGGSSTSTNPGAISFPDTGLYEIILIMKDTTACNSPDTIKKTIHFTKFDVEADFDAPDKCSGDSIMFANLSKYATEYKWDFGDGDTSTAMNPTHNYDTAGTYTVTFIAMNPGACNKADTVVKQISVKPVPTADFTHAPVIPVTNEPVQFTNRSLGATAYNWSFGDGTGSEEVDPRHMYKKTGSYTVCLMAKNSDGCADTICKKVDADVQPLVDIPTGFSPNGDGKNDVLYVRGAAVEKFNLRIYNRWGQKVFEIEADEVNEPKYGWNGEHSGEVQDIEAYAYVLSGTFVDGTTFYKKGNVTLLR